MFRRGAVAAVTSAAWFGLVAGNARADVTLEGCPPWCPTPHVAFKPSAHAPGRWYPGFAFRAFSLRASTEQTRTGETRDGAGAIGVEDAAMGHVHKGWLTARYSDRVALGYGSDGFDGGLSFAGAMGLEPPIGAGHGPYARLGLRGEWLHRQRFHTSAIEFPEAQLGYDVASGSFHLDVGARAALVWVGRYGVDGAVTRRLGDSPDLGVYLDFALRPIVLGASASRVAPKDAPSPVDRAEFLLCGVLGKPTVCARSSFFRGDLRGPGGSETTSAAYVGVSIGLGPGEWRW